MAFYPFQLSGAAIAAALGGQTINGGLTITGGNLVCAGNVQASFGTLIASLAGTGVSIKGGGNCKIGSATLAAGTVTVANTAVTANSKIFLTPTAAGGTPGIPAVTTITPATSFVITSSNPLDTSTIEYLIVEQG
jgi:hypothetical protein